MAEYSVFGVVKKIPTLTGKLWHFDGVTANSLGSRARRSVEESTTDCPLGTRSHAARNATKLANKKY